MFHVSGFGAHRMLLDVSLIHFVANYLSQLEHILGQADQCTKVCLAVK